jgi:hypothetical protein
VRRAQKRGDYSDPGWFKHPAGTLAQEHDGSLDQPQRAPQTAALLGKTGDIEVVVRKPTGHAGH